MRDAGGKEPAASIYIDRIPASRWSTRMLKYHYREVMINLVIPVASVAKKTVLSG
jgi:hypothetical protein